MRESFFACLRQGDVVSPSLQSSARCVANLGLVFIKEDSHGKAILLYKPTSLSETEVCLKIV
jgi:hypothetical protein